MRSESFGQAAIRVGGSEVPLKVAINAKLMIVILGDESANC
jgi:hypothetical protein